MLLVRYKNFLLYPCIRKELTHITDSRKKFETLQKYDEPQIKRKNYFEHFLNKKGSILKPRRSNNGGKNKIIARSNEKIKETSGKKNKS